VKFCALCGLRIPAEIVNTAHHLAGTIDHMHPLSIGGRDNHTNRVAAHSFCNGRKKNRLVVPYHELESWRDYIAKALIKLDPVKYAKQGDKGSLQEARKRSIQPIVYPASWYNFARRKNKEYPGQVWEDDGGAPWPQ
jgi:hypothetical protein